ncbi:MAG: hypothetical protein NT062_05275, partial [Proteobacteria bacterium]|nr:hypothetical protein [Pseudomonadota bacterium]
MQTLVDEYGVKRTDAVMLVALLAFPIEAARELVIAAPNTFAELPNLLRHLRDIEAALREAEAGELGVWDAGSDDDLDRDDHQVEARRMVARLDGDHRAPVLRRRAFDELARRRLTNLHAFRSLYRSIEKSCERIDVRWRDERQRWFEAVAIAAAGQPVVGDLDHPGFAAAWSDEELWPGAPCACDAVDGPHRHCDVCQVGAPRALGRHGVRSVAHVHPLTFERRHLGWACPRHRNDIDAPYPLDWIAQYEALGMF